MIIIFTSNIFNNIFPCHSSLPILLSNCSKVIPCLFALAINSVFSCHLYEIESSSIRGVQKGDLKVGQIVYFKVTGETKKVQGTVQKINISKAIVTSNNLTYNVPLIYLSLT